MDPSTVYEQLLQILADDARTRLGLIQDAADDVFESGGDSFPHEGLARVRHSVRELCTLISDISDFYGHSAGRLSEVVVDFDLRVTLDGVQARLAGAWPQSDWVALTKIRHDVPTLLRGDPARLQDILLGAASFVHAYDSPGSLRMEVTKGWERDDRVELVFHGTLCPHESPSEEEMASFRHVFGAESVDRPLIRQHLRPELSRRLAVALGGSLRSLAGDDSALAFELRLPFQMRTMATRAEPPAAGPTLRGRSCLVVDGNEARRERTEALARLWGLHAEGCNSGRAALEVIRDAVRRQRLFDFVLVDAELEDMPGMALARCVRLDSAAADIRMVLRFGVGLRGDGELAHQSGYDAYLPRDLGVAELREALTILLQSGEGEPKKPPMLTRHSLADRHLEGVRILLVGSDPLGALVLEAVLSRKGFRVERAQDPTAAGELCERNAYGLVLLDLERGSPGDLALAGGLQALLREKGHTLLAVLYDDAGLDQAPDLGAFAPDAMFRKPVDLEQLCRFCESLFFPHLARTPPQRAATGSPPVVVVSNRVEEENPTTFEPLWLEETTMGIGALKLSLIDSYLEDMPVRLESLSTAIAAADLTAAHREVLAARAMALTLGAVATARRLADLAELLQGRRLPEAHAMLTQVRTEAERSLDQLREARPRLLVSSEKAA